MSVKCYICHQTIDGPKRENDGKFSHLHCIESQAKCTHIKLNDDIKPISSGIDKVNLDDHIIGRVAK